MTKEEIYDINGKQPTVGDTIAYSVGWGTGNAYINIATVDSFEERPNTVKMNLTILKTLIGVIMGLKEKHPFSSRSGIANLLLFNNCNFANPNFLFV